DDVDRMNWLRLLAALTRELEWTCVAFCQMTTHVHMLVDVPGDSLPIGMRELNREYSRVFNARHDRVGTFVRKRFGSRRLEGGIDLLGTYAYVVLNPVVDGLCRRPQQWPWSSYRTTVGISPDFPFVDGSLVAAQAGGPEQLRLVVESIARARR